MDEFSEGHYDGVQYERGEIAQMLRDQADANLARGQEAAYYVLRDAAWKVEGRSQRGTFECKVYAATRRYLSETPKGNRDDVLNGHIIAHDQATNTFAVFVGYPDVDEDGTETWPPDAARLVIL